MEDGVSGTDTAAANGGNDASQTVVQVEEVQPSSSLSVSAAEKEAKANQEREAPPGILKTPQSFEDGIQHAVEPQELYEENTRTEK